MNKELEQKLIEKYKYMFAEKDRSTEIMRKHEELTTELVKARTANDEVKIAQIREQQRELGSYYPIVFGFEHDDGWYDLLDDLLGKIEKLDTDKTLRIIQIKEKLGGLRFYTAGTPIRMDIMNMGSFEMGESTDEKQIHEIIDDAEEKSYRICEVCGKPGKLCTTGHWVKTLCRDHREIETWSGYKQSYHPVQFFHEGEEVITPTKLLCKVVKVEPCVEEDTYLYELDDGDIRPQGELKRKPLPHFYKGWFVTNKKYPLIEFLIDSCDYDPINGWKYTLLADWSVLGIGPVIANEADLEVVYDEVEGIKKEKVS